MATKFNFNNSVASLPGTYSQFTASVNNPALANSFGNVLIIDTGSNAGFGAGSGITGTLGSGTDSLYSSSTLKEFRDAIGGGILWDIAEKIFQPNGPGVSPGASSLLYARAATTVAAEATITYSGGGSNGGTAVIQYKNEGVAGNGVKGNQTLSSTTAAPFVVTAVGASTDTHSINLTDPATGAVDIFVYTVPVVPLSISLTAAAIAEGINAGSSKYTATSSGANVIVTSRLPETFEDASDFNGIVTAYNVTGTATGTAGTFAGGVDGSILTRGVGIVMSVGTNDPTKFQIKLYRGSYKGADENGYHYDGVAEAGTTAILLATSPEFNNIATLHTWMETNIQFGSFFTMKSKTVVGTGVVDSADNTANAGINLFAGGTEVYSTAKLDEVLGAAASLNYSWILADQYEDSAKSVDNGKLAAHIVDPNTFGYKMIIIGGGRKGDKFSPGITDGSVDIAQYYDNDRVVVAHGGPKKNTTASPNGFIEKTSLHKAAAAVGRLAGLEPQIPLTFKNIAFDGDLHVLTIKEQNLALNNGVLATIPDAGRLEILQGVNTLQDNQFLLNPNATSHSIQLKRIVAQLNTELTINSKRLLKNPLGSNRNTISAADITQFVTSYLKDRTAAPGDDNLILEFRNVVTVVDQDAYKTTYDVVLNTEITKLFFTGTVYLGF